MWLRTIGDELTGVLDSKTAKDLLESMKSLNKDETSTILMVTHDTFAAIVSGG